MTPDGRFVLFESQAGNLDANVFSVTVFGVGNLFVRDVVARTTTLVTRDRFGIFSATGGGLVFSDTAQMSDDGRWVAFSSTATNLVANDNNQRRDVFVRDLVNRTNILVSANTNRVAGNRDSGNPSMSADGRFVAFQSFAGDLVPNALLVTNNNIYVRDLALGTTTLVSLNTAGTFNLRDSSFGPVINADGRYVAFQSLANDLVADDNLPANFVPALDVFIRDLQARTTTLASAHSGQTNSIATYYTNWTTPGSERNALPISISHDGRFILFQSAGDEATITYSGGISSSTFATFLPGAYLFDQRSGTRTRIASALFPAASEDGRIVAFQAAALEPLTHAVNAVVNVFARDLASDATELISTRDAAFESLTGNAMSQLTPGSISADGRWVTYESFASNLSPADTNGTSDVFVRDLIASTNEWISANFLLDAGSSNGASWPAMLFSLAPARLPVISGNGRRVAFEAVVKTELATNGVNPPLVSGLNNPFTLCVFDRVEHTNWFIAIAGSTNKPGPPATPVWSADGRYLAFQSAAPDPAILNSSLGQIYFRDLTQGTNVFVSRTPNPLVVTGGSKASWGPLLSSDGARLIFLSAASDLVLSTNSISGTNLFLWDAVTGVKTVLSVATNGFGLGRVSQPALSTDGRFAAFLNQAELYVCDLSLQTLSLIATNAAAASFNANGRFLAFESRDRLTGEDTNSSSDIYVLDRLSNTVVLASVNQSATASGNGRSTSPTVSPDGRYVVFSSQASDLVLNDTNGFTDVFLRDLMQGTTLLLSANFTHSAAGNRLSANPVWSADGNVVAFESYAADLTVGDFNEAKDIFVVRLSAGDSDGDVMADDWEVAYFGGLARDGTGDFDNDGQSDLAEFRAGTNPTEDKSIFRAFTLSGPNIADGVMVIWNAVPGRTYRVQYKNRIDDTDWIELQGDVVATSTTGLKLDGATETAAIRFYRVLALP
jgi:Tol biopolymer transport system component